MSIYLVTGGAGFIGSNIVETLLARGDRVRILDNFSTGRWENIDRIVKRYSLIEGKDYTVIRGGEERIDLRGLDLPLVIIEGDLREFTTCRLAVSGVSYVLHQGALPSVPRSISDPLTTNDVNIRGTLNMLLAARDEGIRRFVFASSSSVYGDTPILPKVETMPPNPLSPYALSKLTGEYYSTLFYRLYGLSTVSLRYFNVFGPGQDPTSQYAAVIPKFISAVLSGGAPIIYGDGEQSRDFTYVGDCVRANLLASEAEDVSGRVFNIACGRRITINELFDKIKKIAGSSTVRPKYEAARPGDIRHSLADIGLAAELLGYTPENSIDEGLEKTVEWFKNASPLREQ